MSHALTGAPYPPGGPGASGSQLPHLPDPSPSSSLSPNGAQPQQPASSSAAPVFGPTSPPHPSLFAAPMMSSSSSSSYPADSVYNYNNSGAANGSATNVPGASAAAVSAAPGEDIRSIIAAARATAPVPGAGAAGSPQAVGVEGYPLSQPRSQYPQSQYPQAAQAVPWAQQGAGSAWEQQGSAGYNDPRLVLGAPPMNSASVALSSPVETYVNSLNKNKAGICLLPGNIY